jgi:hypothetical protein
MRVNAHEDLAVKIGPDLPLRRRTAAFCVLPVACERSYLVRGYTGSPREPADVPPQSSGCVRR